MREKLNCPNCGAPIEGCKCNYCGTQFYDLADIPVGQECYIRIRPYSSDKVYMAKVIPSDIEITSMPYSYQEITIKFISVSESRKEKI